jgi:3-oxoacyl-[acyl-carrier protein] reductase
LAALEPVSGRGSNKPGPVDTGMNPADSEMAAEMLGLIALDRYGTSEEIAVS